MPLATDLRPACFRKLRTYTHTNGSNTTVIGRHSSS